MNKETALTRLHQDLGLKRLNPWWAKLEILLGLSVAGLGVFLGNGALARLEDPWLYVAAGLLLFILGGYLALAGHRSHLYQSTNLLTAYLANALRTVDQAPGSEA